MTSKLLAVLGTALALALAAPSSARAGADLATWTSPTGGGVIVPASDQYTARGTMIAATLILRNTVSNAQSVMTFSAAALKNAGHLSVADGAYGANVIVETAAFTMLYPGGLVKQVVHPIAARPSTERPVSYVWDQGQLTAAQLASIVPSQNWITNNSLLEILIGSGGAVLQSTRCNYFLHSLGDGTL